MSTWIALFRGINVGGHNKLPMKELVGALEGLRLGSVKTYIQSGNAVFSCKGKKAPVLARSIAKAIRSSHGFEPRVLVLSLKQLQAAVDGNPYPAAVTEPKTLHLWFLDGRASSPDLEALESVRGRREQFLLRGAVFYLHAPDGIGRSKLAERVERALGVQGTGRNWRSVTKILELAEEI